MRNLVMVLAMLLAFAVAAGAQAEGTGMVAKGMKVGINIAGHRGDDTDSHHKSRTAFVGGGFLTYALTPALAIQPEVLYSQKGYKWDDGGWKETGKYNYLEIPVVLKYMIPLEAPVQPSLFVGAAPAFLLSAEIDEERPDGEYQLLLTESRTRDIKDDTRDFDFGLVFGGGISFDGGAGLIMLDARYTMGMMKVDDSEDKYDVKNKAIAVTVGFGLK